jgi:hypothetical protein
MLNGARDADRDIERGRHGLAGLADLHTVGETPFIDDGSARADRCANHIGDLFEVNEVLFGT